MHPSQPIYRPRSSAVAFTLSFLLSCSSALGQGSDPVSQKSIEPLLLGNLTLNSSHVAFSYAGDLWQVSREGGLASQLTTDPANEAFPLYSPDGRHLAFTRELGSNDDLYVLDLETGQESRLTYHPKLDWAVGWTPDNREILFRSNRDGDGFSRLYRTGREGGLPTALPLPSAYQGTFSPDQTQLAYLPRAFSFLWADRWRHYRGGLTSPLWILDLRSLRVNEITDDTSNARYPMWLGDQIYYLSDKTGIFNLWVYSIPEQRHRQLTFLEDFGIRRAAGTADAIAWIRNGEIFLYPLAEKEPRRVGVKVSVRTAELTTRTVPAARFLETVEWTGKDELLIGARGEVLEFDPESGSAYNLTFTSEVAERYPSRSPDGSLTAWFSDAAGEYQLHLHSAESGEVETLAIEDDPSFYWDSQWSPDSAHLTFTDSRLNLWLFNVETRDFHRLDQSTYVAQGRFEVSWSPDGRWLAYARASANGLRQIIFYDPGTGRRHPLNTGVHSYSPTFDRNGLYLYFLASDNARLAAASDIGWGLLSTQLARPLVLSSIQLVALARTTPLPFDPVSRSPLSEADVSAALDGPVEIEFEEILQRIAPIPVEQADFSELRAGPPGVLLVRQRQWPDAPAAARSIATPLKRLNLAERIRLEPVLEDVDNFSLVDSGSRILFRHGRSLGTLDLSIEDASPATISIEDLRIEVEPAKEWRQMYREAWRLMRDYFYDPEHHGQDLAGLERHYQRYLDSIVRREDLNILFMTMLGHVSVSHLGVAGGDLNRHGDDRGNVGLLGADVVVDGAYYRIEKVLESGPITSPNQLMRSPLRRPGVDVRRGDYLLRIGNEAVTTGRNFYSYWQGTAGQPVEVEVAASPAGDDRRTFSVTPVAGLGGLRRWNWGEERRQMVERLSHGRLAYMSIPSYSLSGGLASAFRTLVAGHQKEGLIIDQRYNGGGTTSDTLIEALSSQPLYYYSYRHGTDFQVPPNTLFGPRVLLVNENNFSAAETFAEMFRLAKVGTIVGQRTGGGGIGAALFQPRLIDGGRIRIPNRAAFNPAGAWDIENYGVTPDVEVSISPREYRLGRDPQLERAVAIALDQIDQMTVTPIRRPPYPRHP